ncbi:MAG: YeeE/YedE thiosulfate transporter family protein [Acidimicrobiia bacterium]
MTRSAPGSVRRRAVRINGWQAGTVMALAAVAAGSFFEVRPPDAYGICMSCHGRDLVNWVTNEAFTTDLTVSQVSLVFPLLTTIGVLIGALVAAITSGEFRWRMPRKPLRSFVVGVLVMNAALVAAGCSTRLALRTSAGDLLGLAGFGAMVAGVILATYWLRWRALR